MILQAFEVQEDVVNNYITFNWMAALLYEVQSACVRKNICHKKLVTFIKCDTIVRLLNF